MAYRTQTHLLGTEENGTLADKVDKELQKILDDGANYGWKLHSISHSLVSQANIFEDDTHRALFNLVWQTP